ncbi:PREDICTED: uncharacterized protein LOC107342090 [Acropora digitifera]|uniref:uncharacterized protein LOC107342090 n=1 Tax=Acropora digitifera TaxID=70779 RepID=UPI00077A587E|nr:PREDICTED: uncharacterized protein LOC107342090 [Acropora digitifera]
MTAGAKVVSLVTSVPLAGVNATKNAAKWSWSFTQGILQSLPLIGQKKEEPRRSTRKVKGNYRRMVNEADPFATSPDRKRKYQQGENEGALTEQLVNVNDHYVSEDEPDYVPDDDEKSASTDDKEGSGHEVDEHGTKQQQQTKSDLKSPKKEQKQPTFDSNSQEKKPPQAKIVNGAEKEKNIEKTKEEIGKTDMGDEKKPSKEDSKPKTGVEGVKPSQEEEAKNKKGGEETKANKKDNAKTNKGQHGKEDYTTVKSLLNLKLY